LRRAKSAGAFTVVNTVYDFMAESEDPEGRWTLGSDESYRFVDLIITDLEEARRLTGREGAPEAVRWFLEQGVRAAIVTSGAEPVWFAATAGDGIDSREAEPGEPRSLPVFSEFRTLNSEACASGDTTGCGDNFCGGVVAEIARSIDASGAKEARYSLETAVRGGIAAGALCLTYVGGTMLEKDKGQKQAMVADVRDQYEQRTR
jgi:sugar/nucleoside kinase (ribokinase family)